MVIADALAALAYSWLIRAGSAQSGKYVLNGVIAGVCMQGFFGFANTALIVGWSPTVVVADIVFGAVAGAAVGAVLKLLHARESRVLAPPVTA